MSYKRFAAATLAALFVSELLATVLHGFLLANDYAPFYGSLLRGGAGDDGPSWQMLFLPVAHLSFAGALVWVYTRVGLTGSLLAQGLKLGFVGWLIGQVPLWLVWYAEQPWPGALVVKQLGLELVSTLLIGITIALFGQRHEARSASYSSA